MTKPQLLLLFGGESSEHDVSIVSAGNVFSAIDLEMYDVTLCYITRDGRWILIDDIDQRDGQRTLLPMPGAKSFKVSDGTVLAVDVIFPVLHGKNGEDGTIQGLARLLHVPIVGCGVLASALCMDKLRTKQLVTGAVNVVPWVDVNANDDIRKRIDYLLDSNFDHGSSYLETIVGTGPWFVKPSRAGSSVGVTKVGDKDDLFAALQEVFKFDDSALIEQAIEGKELEVAVLGNFPDIQASGVGEIIPGETFYSYEDKYAADSKSQVILKADLPDALARIIREQAMTAYKLLGCSGLARVDFFLSKDNEIYLNEVNTMPGFTDISMYPKLWQSSGIGYGELVDRLITLALEH